MGRGGKETSQRFLLVAAKRKHNTFLSTFIFSFNDFCMTLESKCNFPHFFKNAFDLYKLF